MIGGLAALLGLCVWLAPAAGAWAGAPTEQLRGTVDRIIGILDNPALKGDARAKERHASVRREADEIFDFGETARRALGRHWQGLAEKDRQEFVGLFADLLEHAYVSRIDRYSGEKIVYAGDSVEGDLATVKTRFITKQGTEVPVDYRMLRRGARWQVYDVVIEGVSLVANYRTQFNKIIQTASYEELVARMKNRQGDLSAPGAEPGRKDRRS
jgi:phospholipid transport system substrate-binding protein